MAVTQISVFVENKRGRLAEITGILEQAQIDIHAISIADTTNFGILRMIVNQPEEACQAISAAGYTVNATEVIAAEVPNKPGGLHHVLEILDQNGVSVEYLYSFVRLHSDSVLILFKVEFLEDASEALQAAQVRVLTTEEIRDMQAE